MSKVDENIDAEGVSFVTSKKNKVLRLRKRAVYNRDEILSILDNGLMAQVNEIFFARFVC
jgi:uncharacterized protein YdcH (DUF465 family)